MTEMTKERLCKTWRNFRSLASAGGCVHLLTYFVRAFKYSQSHRPEPRFAQKGAQGGEDPILKAWRCKEKHQLDLWENMRQFEFWSFCFCNMATFYTFYMIRIMHGIKSGSSVFQSALGLETRQSSCWVGTRVGVSQGVPNREASRFFPLFQWLPTVVFRCQGAVPWCCNWHHNMLARQLLRVLANVWGCPAKNISWMIVFLFFSFSVWSW